MLSGSRVSTELKKNVSNFMYRCVFCSDGKAVIKLWVASSIRPAYYPGARNTVMNTVVSTRRANSRKSSKARGFKHTGLYISHFIARHDIAPLDLLAAVYNKFLPFCLDSSSRKVVNESS